MVSNRVPCKDVRYPNYDGDAAKKYVISSFEKHIGWHLVKEGLPSPYVMERACCGHLYIGYGPGQTHKEGCEKEAERENTNKKRKR
jgi:hypothetical protein